MAKGTEMVVAITVTYNDYGYLKRALQYLRSQTVKVSKIVVVDNHSDEEFKELLAGEEDERVEVLWLPDNVGGAGGFEAGMRFAYQRYDAEWFWLMDADAYPEKDCLEKLLVHADPGRKIGFLAPIIFGDDLKEYQLYHHKRVSKLLFRDHPAYETYGQIPPGEAPIEADAFVGPLISREAIDSVGFADGSLFIYGDDFEYTYRITRTFDGLLIKDAVINHRDQPTRKGQPVHNWWKDYYDLRNWLFLVRKYQQKKLLRCIGTGLVILRGAKRTAKTFLLPVDMSLKKRYCALMRRAVMDGLKDRRGKTVDPRAFATEIKQIGNKSTD